MHKGNLVETIQWRIAKSTALPKASLDFHSGVGLNQAQQNSQACLSLENYSKTKLIV